MARMTGPAQAERVVYRTFGTKKGLPYDSGTEVPLYADVQCSLPADVLALDGGSLVPAGGTIPRVFITSTLEIAQFQLPDVPDPVVYTRVDGGPVIALHPDTDAVMDNLRGRIVVLETSAVPNYGAPQSKSANFTAAPGVIYLVDTTAGSVTCTLPLANVAGQQLVIKLTAGSNPVVVNRAGSDLIGTVITASITLASEIWELESSGTGVWTVIGNSKGLSSLDARFAPASATTTAIGAAAALAIVFGA